MKSGINCERISKMRGRPARSGPWWLNSLATARVGLPAQQSWTLSAAQRRGRATLEIEG